MSFLSRIFSKSAQNPNTYDSYGLTPLMWAAVKGDAEKALDLIAQGADVNAGCGAPRFWLSHDYTPMTTPLHMAAYHGNRAVVEMLLRHGADMNAKNDAGETPLDCAINMKNSADGRHVRKTRSSWPSQALQKSFRKIDDMRRRYDAVVGVLAASGATTALYSLPEGFEGQVKSLPAAKDRPEI